MWRHILDAVIGTIIVAIIYFSLANLPLPIMAIAYLMSAIAGSFNVILFVVVAIMLAVAAWWRSRYSAGAFPVRGPLVFGGGHAAHRGRRA